VPGVIDKRGVLPTLDGAVLELGSGRNKRIVDAIGVDLLDSEMTDVVGDVFDVLAEIETGAVSAIHSWHFFEHVEDIEGLLASCARVLRRGGEMQVTVPHFSNPYFFSDPTHSRAFGLYTFCYLAESRLFRRGTPRYRDDFDFDLVDVRLHFTSDTWPWRAKVRELFNVINRSRALQEFYEENCTGWLSCYELTYVLARR
jgi:SAM-dependent methyltransferase